jgi:hypothetical protein
VVSASPDGPARTDDGRYIVVDGRRWRATDPAIPEPLAAELRSALMAARREVGRATRAGDDAGVVLARSQVQDAKVALGERGRPWWEPLEPAATRERTEATIRSLLRHRDGRTICPSDVARAIGGASWRTCMDDVRAVARDLAAAGEVVVLQRGEPVTGPTRGPVRVGPGPRFR